jgi:hypothetical protein
MALMLNGCTRPPSIQLLSSKVLNFPSASGIAFFNDTLYVFGDNATRLLLLTTGYQPVRSYVYDNRMDSALGKETKPDIESALLIEHIGKPVLVGVGSMSGSNRWSVYLLEIGNDMLTRSSFFKSGTTFNGIADINIEGSTTFGNGILFCNRANLSTRKNHLLWWNRKDNVVIKEITLPATDGVAGLSGLHYIKEKDLLLFTASEEETASTYEDGAIGNSYLGWIANFSSAWKKEKPKADGFLKLADFNRAFTGQKIESVCLEKSSGNSFLLHLAADNDDGKSVLFKVKLSL